MWVCPSHQDIRLFSGLTSFPGTSRVLPMAGIKYSSGIFNCIAFSCVRKKKSLHPVAMPRITLARSPKVGFVESLLVGGLESPVDRPSCKSLWWISMSSLSVSLKPETVHLLRALVGLMLHLVQKNSCLG